MPSEQDSDSDRTVYIMQLGIGAGVGFILGGLLALRLSLTMSWPTPTIIFIGAIAVGVSWAHYRTRDQ